MIGYDGLWDESRDAGRASRWQDLVDNSRLQSTPVCV